MNIVIIISIFVVEYANIRGRVRKWKNKKGKRRVIPGL